MWSTDTKPEGYKVGVTGLRLTGFEPTALDVTMSSSSSVVGAKNETLTVAVGADILTNEGYVILHVPEYYVGAGQDYMISSELPTPCTCSHGKVLSCEFNKRQRELTIHYRFSKQAIPDEVEYQIGSFNNPIVEGATTFKVEALDEEKWEIGKAEDVTIRGIKDAASF